MSYSKASNRAAQKYQQEKLDDFHLRLKKGVKDVWHKEARIRGMTFTAFLTAAVGEYISKDRKGENV